MGRPSKEQRLADVHEAARREFATIHSAGLEVRDGCVSDIRFALVDGSQWEGVLQKVNNKPMFEFNKVGQSIDRIETDFRNNRMDVAFESKDGAPSGKLPDTCAAIYRADEQDSRAQRAYGNAFKELAAGGVGAWRLRARYADENSEDGEDDADEARPQRIRFESITGAATRVFFDPNANEVDKSDARFCYVLYSMTVEQYKREYDDDPASWPNDVNKYGFEWSTKNSVFLAEYYVVEPQGETIVVFRGLDDEEIEHTDTELEDPELVRELEATGYVEVSQRKSKRRRVHKYLLNGIRVIEDCGRIAGRHIPIVVAYANRIVIDDVEHYAGHVRRAKDPQRILNLMISQFAEICALAPSEKPIVSPEQIAGHEATWADDNVKRYAYRLINLLYDANGNIVISGPLGSVKSPDVPPALAGLTQLAETGLQDILGNPRETEKMVSHVPGSRVEMLQQTLDKQSEPYISSMSEAMHRNGVIWLSMARELYTQPGRKMKGVDALGKKSQIELMRPVIDPETKKLTKENDLSRAHMDVVITVGPSRESQRQAAFDASTSVLPVVQDQETQRVLSLHATRNMPGEGASGLREWARKNLVTLGAETPTPEDEQRMAAAAQSAQPSANDQYLVAAAEAEKAKAEKTRADIALTGAQADKAKADTIATLADIDLNRQAAAVDTAKSLHEMTLAQASLGQSPQGPGSTL